MLKWFISLEGCPTDTTIQIKVSNIYAIISILSSATTKPMEGFHNPTLYQEEL